MGIHDTEMAKHSYTETVVGEPVAVAVDLRNGSEIGFETGEILRFKTFHFQWKNQPTLPGSLYCNNDHQRVL